MIDSLIEIAAPWIVGTAILLIIALVLRYRRQARREPFSPWRLAYFMEFLTNADLLEEVATPESHSNAVGVSAEAGSTDFAISVHSGLITSAVGEAIRSHN